MKKILITILILIITNIYSLSFAKVDILHYDSEDHEYTGHEINLVLNKSKFEFSENQMEPIILNNRTLVPVREVFENLGGVVGWNGEEQRVDVSFGDKSISLWINNTIAKFNGEDEQIDVPAKIINNKTMVPARFISERGGLNVGWDAESYTVNIDYPIANITSYEIATINGTKCLVVNSNEPISGYKYTSLPEDGESPFRLLLDIENSNFSFDKSTNVLEDEIIARIRFGDQGNNVNRIVLDLNKEQEDYVVVKSKDLKKLYFAFSENFEIPEEKLEIVDDEKSENIIVEESGEIANSKEDDISGENVDDKKVEISGDDNKTEVIDDKKASEENEIFSGDDDQDTLIISGENKNEDIDEEKSGEVEIDSIDSGEEKEEEEDKKESLEEEEEEEKPKNSNKKKEIKIDTTITAIKYSTVSNRVKVKYKGKIKYSGMTLTDPNRVVVDIENALLDTSGPDEINVKTGQISCIRFSQYEEDIVRIVLDVRGKSDFKIYEKSGELQIETKESTYKNIKYKKNTSNAQITLNAVLVSELDFKEDSKKNTITIKYQDGKDYFGTGTLTPSDALVDTIETDGNKIIIYASTKVDFAVRKSSSNAVITIREKEEDDEEPVIEEPVKKDDEEKPTKTETIVKPKTNKPVIMIDVGHGGTDPGACNGDAEEKVYNLKIALKLYDKLSERDDLEVYIDRKNNDTYLNREDRVAYATSLKPDFIVSVHNNSLDNKSYSGTMVLYYNNDTESDYGDITSKECAQIVLDNLVENLGTINRGVVSRQDLHILSKTPCPSILCEVCFISNDDELSRLKTNSFQEKAAQAIFDGVLEIIKDLK